MKIALCDDNEDFLCLLKDYIITYFKEKNSPLPDITLFQNGEALLSADEEYDLVFLDIEMPGAGGILVGRQLKGRNRDTIIFVVTSYPEYLDDAMRFHVFRYLSKPLRKERLFQNLNDAMRLYHTRQRKIFIETKDGGASVSTSKIICVEASEKKTIVHTTVGDYDSVHTLSYWEDHLPSQIFFCPHRKFIVNFIYVTDFDREMIALYGGHIKAYMSRRKYTQFKDAYLQYLSALS